MNPTKLDEAFSSCKDQWVTLILRQNTTLPIRELKKLIDEKNIIVDSATEMLIRELSKAKKEVFVYNPVYMPINIHTGSDRGCINRVLAPSVANVHAYFG